MEYLYTIKIQRPPHTEMAFRLMPEKQTKNMEVHHHPDLHHTKKKWKEYLLEFLMIFLAVTLGFFAETIREKISESHREKDYIAGLISNIQSDTLELKGIVNRNDLALKGIDSLMKVSRNNFLTTSTQDSIFFYAMQYTISLHLFGFNDLTLVQLRNAGGYSLIKTGNVADSIAMYESKNNDIKTEEKFVIDYYSQAWTAFKQTFDATLANQFFQAYNTTTKIPANMYVLITKDEEKIHLLLNNYWTYAIVLNSYNRMLKEHLLYLAGFATYLKQNYDIE